ncbi:MAG: NADPH-dependent glutamate synthase [Chloroflexi bacterium]|nr:NADPH-dependent glutamate synthase [Chloroflexota bacterium]MBU1751010.1 NADPH-dependent glutamate synthase [Chloroflexota bacterium]
MPVDLNRQPMPMQDPQERAHNFYQVALGYSWEQAQAEAQRCLQCKKVPCMAGCPVEVRIPEFIAAMRDGDLALASQILKSRNNLPAICGMVCPQETQCEEVCVLGKKGAPIAIGRLERYVADWERAQGTETPNPAAPTGHKVACIGSGPASLTAAGDLARMGHAVTIFEALHVPGGVLMYGIPEFRLPKAVVQAEIDYVRSLGVEVVVDAVIGQLFTIDELLDERGYEAIFLGTGAGLPIFMGIPGENYNGVYSANEFLTRVNLMKAYLFPEYDTPVKRGKRVAVIGGGNVAMDSARCALRLGADKVYIVYRRSEEEMPARREEVENAHEEGVEFMLLTNPIRVLGDQGGWVSGMECVRNRLGEPDASGRRRPENIPGSEFLLDVDIVIVAIGTTPNPLVPRTTPGLETSRRGTVVVVDEDAGLTRKGRVWAGGDVVTGSATVISAMGAGKRAARAIDAFLKE